MVEAGTVCSLLLPLFGVARVSGVSIVGTILFTFFPKFVVVLAGRLFLMAPWYFLKWSEACTQFPKLEEQLLHLILMVILFCLWVSERCFLILLMPEVAQISLLQRTHLTVLHLGERLKANLLCALHHGYL